MKPTLWSLIALIHVIGPIPFRLIIVCYVAVCAISQPCQSNEIMPTDVFLKLGHPLMKAAQFFRIHMHKKRIVQILHHI